MAHSRPPRRTLLKASGVALAVPLLAGCTGNGGPADGNGGDTGTPGENGEDRFDGWFDGVRNYDGVDDHRGEDEVTVSVGGETGLQFEPPAIEVDPGTTVVWEWTGEGGEHNVVHEDGAFESDLVAEAGHTFEHTFDEAGTFRYYCEPHRPAGMKGVVLVEP